MFFFLRSERKRGGDELFVSCKIKRKEGKKKKEKRCFHYVSPRRQGGEGIQMKFIAASEFM